jgi:hypothetical protein
MLFRYIVPDSRDIAFAVEAVVLVDAFEVMYGGAAPGAPLLSLRPRCLFKRGLRQELDSELELVKKLICELNLEAHSSGGVWL